MNITINHKEYFTNISDNEVIEKCINFFSKGCTSYAITNVDPKFHICKTKEKGIDVVMVNDLNNEFKFVPVWAKNINEPDAILRKGLDLIQL